MLCKSWNALSVIYIINEKQWAEYSNNSNFQHPALPENEQLQQL